MSGIHVMHFTSKYFKFYCNPNKLGPCSSVSEEDGVSEKLFTKQLCLFSQIKKKSVLY